MNIKTVTTRHFVVGEHLNHHGTLFAARAASWFVEAGLMAAAECVPADGGASRHQKRKDRSEQSEGCPGQQKKEIKKEIKIERNRKIG